MEKSNALVVAGIPDVKDHVDDLKGLLLMSSALPVPP
jgi:hypothetical protein